MQQVIVYIIIAGALLYLGVRFLGGNKSANCDNCDAAPKQAKKNA